MKIIIALLFSSIAFANQSVDLIKLPVAPNDYFEILSKNKSKCMRSGYVTLQKGKSVGFHNTDNFEEVVIALEGRGVMETKGVGKTNFTKGDVIHALPHSEHNVTNNDDAPLRYIYVVANTLCGR